MEQLFLTILNRAVTAGWLVLLVMVLRVVLKKAPRAAHYGLWAIVAVRLLWPGDLLPRAGVSLVPTTEPISGDVLTAAGTAVSGGLPAVGSPAGAAAAETAARTGQSLGHIAAVVWLVGMAAMALYLAGSYVRLRVRLRTAVRLEDGCPWDRVQTHTSIRKDFIEETYEVIEAIDNDDPVLMCEELGDVMLQTVFHADIEREAGRFTVEDVLDGITDKLIHRHPHVFGDVKADTSEKVLDNWDKIKKKEKGRDSTTASMKSIPPALPALMRAQKIGKYAAKAGFDFPDAESAFGKIPEETAEVAELIGGDDRDRLEEELGDLLFAVVNVCRKTGIDAEYALDRANEKFLRRFSHVEDDVCASGKKISDLEMETLDSIWDRNKASER